MKFGINITYRTGDSFKSYDAQDDIGWEFEDIEQAKETLKRIKEHHKWYTDTGCGWSGSNAPPPRWLQELMTKPDEDDIGPQSVCFMCGDREVILAYPFWTGYFETFYDATIYLSEY